MLKDSYKLKLDKTGLTVFFAWIAYYSTAEPTTMEGKMVLSISMSIYKKLLPKTFDPQPKMTIKLTATEAIGVYLLFSRHEFQDPLQLAVIQPILDNIHKYYI